MTVVVAVLRGWMIERLDRPIACAKTAAEKGYQRKHKEPGSEARACCPSSRSPLVKRASYPCSTVGRLFFRNLSHRPGRSRPIGPVRERKSCQGQPSDRGHTDRDHSSEEGALLGESSATGRAEKKKGRANKTRRRRASQSKKTKHKSIQEQVRKAYQPGPAMTSPAGPPPTRNGWSCRPSFSNNTRHHTPPPYPPGPVPSTFTCSRPRSRHRVSSSARSSSVPQPPASSAKAQFWPGTREALCPWRCALVRRARLGIGSLQSSVL